MAEPNDSTSSGTMVSIDVFVKVSGLRADQLAGFRRWVSSRKVGKQTVAGWRELHEQFLRRPIK
jgi:hypothetical protein